MTSSGLKYAVAVGALVLGIGMAAHKVDAADNTTITATLTTLGVLDVTDVAQMDFGTWYLDTVGGNTTLVKATTGAVTPTVSGTGVATVSTANTTPAEVTVEITGGGASEDGTVVNVTRGAITNFTDTNAVLSDITYRTATETGENTLAESTPAPVTIVLGGTPEPVYFGGTITLTDNIASNTAHTASFTVTFSY